MPPQDWFYGIDYCSSYEIVNELKKHNKNEVYIFNDLNIFLKKNIYKRYFKINLSISLF